MLRSMLVGLDGSAYSTAAVELGIRWAQRFDALLVGLGIIDEPSIRACEPTPLGAGAFKQERDAALLADAQHRVRDFLSRFSLRCAEAQVACKLLEDVGLPAEAIQLEAQRYDLIMLGKQTHYQFETQVHPDDTLRQVLRNSPRPVVTVPERLGGEGPVVIGFDGSLQAARTLQLLVGLSLPALGETHVVTVHADPLEARRIAERAVDFLRLHNVSAHVSCLAPSDSPARVLLDEAHRIGAGLLAIGAYGQAGLREWIFGSVTRRLLRETTLPLLLYH